MDIREPDVVTDVASSAPIDLRSRIVDVALAFCAIVTMAMCLSGIVWPILYYTRNEALVTLNQQLTNDLQQLQQQAQSIINQQQAQIEVLKKAK